jgi:hypothetical protein
VIEEEVGGLALVTAGASGNIHPTAHGNSQEMGRMLGETVVRIARGVECTPRDGICCVKEETALPVREHSAKDIEQMDYICDKTFRTEEQRKRYKDYFHKHADWCRKLERKEGSIRATIQAVVIGDIALVGVPGELFTELGLAIKEKSPLAHTLIITHANDAVGYIPSTKGYEEGGYQPFNTTVGKGSGEMIAAKALEMLERCKSLA